MIRHCMERACSMLAYHYLLVTVTLGKIISLRLGDDCPPHSTILFCQRPWNFNRLQTVQTPGPFDVG